MGGNKAYHLFPPIFPQKAESAREKPDFPQTKVMLFLESVSSFNHDNVSVAKNSRLILVFTSH